MNPRTMRSALLASSALALLLLVLVSACNGGAASHKETWFCPMHPTYVTDHPGSCPICNMTLVKKNGANPASGAAAPAERKVLFYRSPMDPSITSPVPAKDAMGMDFLPVYEGEAEEAQGSSLGDRAAVAINDAGLLLAGVRTETAQRESLGRTIRAVGGVPPDERRQAKVESRVSGWVSALAADFTGRQVRRGERMVTIDSPELYAAQSEYLAASEAAKRFLASSLPEVRRGGDDLIFAARRRLELLNVPESVLEELERTRVARRTIDFAAPMSGVVTEKNVVLGQRIEPGMQLYTIADLSHIWIEGDFYEAEASLVQIGQEANIHLPFEAAAALPARISYIYPQLATETRTLRVRLELDNPGLRLKPGMFVDVELSVPLGDGVVVPDSAVLDSGARKLVFVEISSGRFAPREVVVEHRSAGKALVTSGLEEGDRVAVKANFLLDSESRLRGAIAAMASEKGKSESAGDRP